MTMQRGLGRGLEALLSVSNSDEPEENSVLELKITDIEPNKNQPRKVFDQDKLTEMAESIKEHGIIQPIVVRKVDDRYEIIAGERRWRAARIAGLSKVPVVIRQMTDKQLMEAALIENLQREDLNPIEEANGYENLMKEYSLTQEQISKVIGKSRPAIANSLRLLNLDERVQELISQDKLTAGHARALVIIEDNQLQYEIAKKISEHGLSVRETEKLIKSVENKKTVKTKTKSPIFIELEEHLQSILGTKVTIHSNKNKGKIEIEYYSNDDLDRIISMLKR